jgi:hypothetical protein
MYKQREKYNQWGFRRHFYHVKIKFSTFFFLQLKLRTICYKKQEKKVRKNFILVVKNVVKKNNFFFIANFLPPFYLTADNFRQIKNHILIGLEVPNTAFKNQGGLWGDFFELFNPRRTSFGFSKNPCAKSITKRICILRHCSTAPPLPRSWAGRWANFGGP